MGAFSIAFDTIIVGALSVPCLLLVIYLFFLSDVEGKIDLSEKESRIKKLLDWTIKQQPAVTGVLLFATAYSLGSVVSRIAQDFLDDGDMRLQVSRYLFRVGATESAIRANVYCQTLKRGTVTPKTGDPLTQRREEFKTAAPDCRYTGWLIIRHDKLWVIERIRAQEDLAKDIFFVQEAAVLLKGTDPNER